MQGSRGTAKLWKVGLPWPTPAGIALHAAGTALMAAGLAEAANGPILIGSALLAFAVTAQVFCHRTVERLETTWRLPDDPRAEETTFLEIAVAAASRWLPAPAIRVAWMPGRDRPSEEEGVEAAPERPARLRGAFPRRGKAPPGWIRLTSDFPFGLFRCRAFARLQGEVVVLPGRFALPRGWSVPVRRGFRMQEWGAYERVRSGGVPAGAREWNPGDRARDIHWKISARHFPRLFVADREEPVGDRVTLFLDDRSPGEGAGAERRFETALRFAAAVTEELRGRGFRVVTVTAAGRRHEGSGAAGDALRFLALLQPSPDARAPEWGRLAAAEARGEAMVVVSPLDEAGEGAAVFGMRKIHGLAS